MQFVSGTKTHEKDQCKRPHLPICSTTQPESKVPRLGFGIVPVLLDAAHDEQDLIVFEEAPVLLLARAIWKVNEEYVPSDANDDGENTLDNLEAVSKRRLVRSK